MRMMHNAGQQCTMQPCTIEVVYNAALTNQDGQTHGTDNITPPANAGGNNTMIRLCKLQI